MRSQKQQKSPESELREDLVHKLFASKIRKLESYNQLSNCIWSYMPFGENRTKTTGSLLKAKGTMRGFPDYMFCKLENNHPLIVFLEFKSKRNNNDLTTEQKEFFSFFNGVEKVFCYKVFSSNEGIDILIKHRFLVCTS